MQTIPLVISVDMPKFQAKYTIQTNLDDIEKRTLAFGYNVNRSGGRPEKGQADDTGAQLMIRISRLEATIQISPNRILTWWAGEYERIDEIEHALEDILELKSDLPLKSLRKSVPTLLEERLRFGLITEILRLQEEHREEFRRELDQACREGRLEDVVEKEITREYSIIRTLKQNGASGAEEKEREFNEAVIILRKLSKGF